MFHISNQPCKRTKFNYKTLAAKVASTTLTTKAVDKTQVREVAEKSFRSTVSFLMTCATTLLQIGEVQPGRDKVIKATGGAQTLVRLVSETNESVPVRPLFSKNIHSTDDSSVYFVSAHDDIDGYEWRVSQNDGTDTGVKSRYGKTPTSILMRQHERLTWTVSADSTVTTPYTSFISLSIHELPTTTYKNGILMIPIKGLAAEL